MAIWKDRLRRHYLQLISTFTAPIIEPKEELTLHQKCETLTSGLDPTIFNRYTVVDGISSVVNVPFATIDVYIDELHKRIDTLQSTNTVLADDCRWTAKPVKLNDFFLTHDDYYQNVPMAVRNFREASILLCHALRDAEIATPSVSAYNLRLISPLLNNINDIAIVLNSVIKRT